VLWFDGANYASTWELTSIVMPETRFFHTIAISNGQIYVLGGLSDIGTSGCPLVATVDRYDIQAGTWDSSAVPPLPVPSFDASAIVDGLGRIWYMGGQVDCNPANIFTDRVDIFDPSQPHLGWQAGPSLNTARARFGCVLEDGSKVYAIGGYSDAGHIQSVERINTCSPSAWEMLPESLPGPTTNDDQATLGSDGNIYVVGGFGAFTFTNRVVRRDFLSGSWASVDSLITARSGHRVVHGMDNSLYALGGSVSGCNSSVDVERMPTPPTYGGFPDCNSNGVADSCDQRMVRVPAEAVPYFAGQDQSILEAGFAPTVDWALDPWDVAALGDHFNLHNDTAPWEGVLREEIQAGSNEGFTIADRTAASTIPPALPVQSGERITILAVGLWARGPLLPHVGPDGGTSFVTHDEYETLGVSRIDGCPGDSLIGVFLSDDLQDPNNTPSRLTCGSPSMLSPQLQQAFYIGTGTVGLVVPPGGTRLFLGFHDSHGWWNNDGDVEVIIFTDCNTNAIRDDCEPDGDADGTIDACDNCPFVANTDQADFDGDAAGDECDPDIDNDGVDNGPDVCDFTPTTLPSNLIEPDGSVLGDLDGDCDVDLIDYAIMQARFTGPNPAP